jgi:PEGA domain/Sulfatase-modifying factor enzyme 1
MALFGPFEVGRTLDSNAGATVFEARKEGDPKGRFVVKVFSLERLLTEEQAETRSELDPLFKDIGASFTSRVSVQKKASEASRNFAPILAAGTDERGAWYATHFYTRSIQGMLDRLVVLDGRDIFHIVSSLAQAALVLKKTAGRSHGNLKPSNIFIEGAGKARSSRIVILDPMPGGGLEAASYETADLRAIGELIYQLTLHRKVDFSTGWVIVPVETSREWTETFGEQTPAWLALCNKLLDPGLSTRNYNLEQLQTELAPLTPKPPLPISLLTGIAVAVLALAIGLFLAIPRAKPTMLVLTSDPPGATVIVTPGDEISGRTNLAPANGKPLKLPLEEGDYSVKVLYRDLETRRLKVSIVKGNTLTTNLALAYGRLVLRSEPSGAEFQLGGQGPQLHTPYTNAYFKPGPISLQLSLPGYETATVSNTVPAGHGELALVAKLKPPPPGDVLVAFTSDPPGAEVFVDDAAFGKTPLSRSLKEGTHRVRTHLPPFADQQRDMTVRGKSATQDFQFPYGTLDLASDPVGAQVLIDDRPVAVTPTNLYWPVGQFTITLRADGYDPTNQQVAVVQRATNRLNPSLAARAGFVEIASDPPGAEIRDQTDKLLATTVAEGFTKVALPPRKAVTLRATCVDLKPIEGKTVEVMPGETKRLDLFRFEYGTAVFADMQPPDIRSSVTVRQTGGKPAPIGAPIYQRPNEGYSYDVEAPGYQTSTTIIVVTPKQNRQVSLTLHRLTVPVKLLSDPPGARFFTALGEELKPEGQDYLLPWGPVDLVARHGKLGALTNSVNLKLGAANPVPPFKFAFGTVVLTNLPQGVVVREGTEELTPLPGPDKLAYDKPGSHIYDLYWGSQKIDTVTTNLTPDVALVLESRAAAREFSNSIGMRLVKVPNLGGQGKDGWVGKYEVTQNEYQSIMGDNPSGHQLGSNYPVENVKWSKAREFCQKLSQRDQAAGLFRGQYFLPTREQWVLFAANATEKDAVVKAAQPAAVGSKGPNPLGLYDTRGNVWEWLGETNGANRSYIGGAFDSWLPKSIAYGGTEDRAQDDAQPDIGFRVVLVPIQPNP